MRMMLTLMVAATLSMIGGKAVAAPDGVGDCIAKIEAVKVALDGVEITGRNAEKDRAGLERKLHEATFKLMIGKYADSVQKLVDFQSKCIALASSRKPKMDMADAEMLVALAQIAIDCILEL